MCDAEFLFFGRIGRLRKQHEQIGEIKRQTWHYTSLSPSPSQEIMTLYQISPIISKLVVSLGILQHHLWLLELVPETQRCEWCSISTLFTTRSNTFEYNIYGRQRKHQKTTSARARPSDMHIPRNTPGPRLHQRQGELRAVVASHHVLGGRVLPMKGPNDFKGTFGFCLEHVPCIRAGLASHV